METKAVVTNREEAIKLIKNDERYIKMVSGFSKGHTNILSIEYANIDVDINNINRVNKDEDITSYLCEGANGIGVSSFCRIPKIIESIDYSNNEIKIHINRKDWTYYYKVFKEMFRNIISDNDLEDYVDIYINKAECWIKVM